MISFNISTQESTEILHYVNDCNVQLGRNCELLYKLPTEYCHCLDGQLFYDLPSPGHVVFMCGGIHYGEVEELVSVERWSYSRGASYVVECTMGRLRDWSL